MREAIAKNKHLLVLSDLHKGASISKYKGELREAIERAIDSADHIVLNGDIFELFYAEHKKHAKSGAVIEDAITCALATLTSLALAYPEKQFHFILGNHENINEFREGKPLEPTSSDPYWGGLDGLAKTFPNFEWHPEAIRLGDALFTHGDLQLAKQTDKTRPRCGVKEATKYHKRTQLYEIMEEPGQAIVDRLRTPKKMVKEVSKQLQKRTEYEDFYYSHQKKNHLFSLDWVRHVFTGHTHVPFDNKEEPKTKGSPQSQRHHHNTGGLTKGRGVKEIKDIQALSATLTADGEIQNVQRTFGKPTELVI